MALIGEITGSGGLTASGSVFISGSLQLSQETGDPTILENMGGAIYIKEDSAGANKFYFKNSGATVSELGGLGSANTWSETQTFSEITGSSGFLVADDKKIYLGTDKDWLIEYDENGDDDLKMAGTTFTMTTDTATFTSANATDPLVIIKNTTNDTGCARLRFVKDKGAAGAANDDVGIIQFYGDDASQDQVLFGRIRTRVAVHTNGQEGGKMQFAVASHDGELNAGLTIGDGDAEDEVDVTIGNGANSLVTIAGDLDIPNGGFALGSDASGDMYYNNSSGILTRIAVGSNNHVLTLDGAVPGWESAAGGGDVSAGSTFTTAGVIMACDGDDKTIDEPGATLTTNSQGLTVSGVTKVGASAGSGQDFFAYSAGTAAHVGIQWDADGNTEGTLIGGADDHGVDFKFFGETSGKYVQWDMSGDELVLATSAKLSFHDAAGGENIVASADGHLEVNAGTTLDMTAPTVDINASTEVTIDTDTVTISSANSQDPLVIIKNTTDDANSARLRFVKDKGAAGDDNDVVGMIEFVGDDDAQDQVLFGRIAVQVVDASNGAEGGALALSVATHDGEIQNGLVLTDGDAEDEIDVTIGNGANSLVTIAGDLDIPNGGFALGSDASGDMYYNNSSGILTRIAVGSDNHVLTLDGAVPGWEAAGAASSLAADDISAGDAAVSIATTSGNITVDSNAGAVSIDGHTGVTVASSNSGDVTLDSVANINIDAATGDVVFKDAGTAQLKIDMDTTSAEIRIELEVNGDDLVFYQFDETEVLRLTDGGMVEVKDNLSLKSDSSVIKFGANEEITLTHEHDVGLILEGNGVSACPVLTLKNTNNDATGGTLKFLKDGGNVADNDVVGNITFVSEDDGDNAHTFASIVATIPDMTGGAEEGKLTLNVASHDGEIQPGLIVASGDAEDEVDVTIGNGTASITTVAGSLSVTHNVNIDSSPADESCSGITAIFTAGEDLSRGEVVYFKAGDSKMWKAVATAAATSRCVAMAAADISADAAGLFLLEGFLTDNGTFPAYTITGVLYTPEAETSSENVPEQTAPDTDGDFVQVIGWAVTANTVYFRPDSTVIEVA